MGRRILLRALWSFSLLSILMLLPTSVAHADNCGSFSDCFSTTDAAAGVTVAVAVIIAIALFALPQLLEQPPTTAPDAPEQLPQSGEPLPPPPLIPPVSPQEAEEVQSRFRREDRSSSNVPTGPLPPPRDPYLPEPRPELQAPAAQPVHQGPYPAPEHLQEAQLGQHHYEEHLHAAAEQSHEGSLYPDSGMHHEHSVGPEALHQQPHSPEALHRQPATPEASHQQPVSPESLHRQPALSESSHQQPVSPEGLHQQPVSPEASHHQPALSEEKSLASSQEAQSSPSRLLSGEQSVHSANEAQAPQQGSEVQISHIPSEAQIPRVSPEAQISRVGPESQLARTGPEVQIPRPGAEARDALMLPIGPEASFALAGLHHITAISANPQLNIDFYTGLLGLRLAKVTVNFERPDMYQFYYGNALGQPGTILSFLCQPNSARGSRGTGQIISLAFVVAENALPFWADYLTRNSIVIGGPHQRFDTQALSFFDPDGLQIDLIAQRVTEERHIWQNGRIPPAYALRGLHSVSIAVAQYEATAMLLHRGLNFQQVAEEGNRRRYQAGSGLTGTLLDVVHLPSVPAGTLGAGIVHHVGWRTPGEAQQLAWGYRLNDLGLNVSPIVDHFYFRACYFRDPGGVLFAIATDTPGFLLDEPPEHLGTHLMLPPWLEQQRAQLVRTLPPLRLPTSTRGR